MEIIIVIAAVWIFAKIVKALLRGYGKVTLRMTSENITGISGPCCST